MRTRRASLPQLAMAVLVGAGISGLMSTSPIAKAATALQVLPAVAPSRRRQFGGPGGGRCAANKGWSVAEGKRRARRRRNQILQKRRSRG